MTEGLRQEGSHGTIEGEGSDETVVDKGKRRDIGEGRARVGGFLEFQTLAAF